jgi:acyl carrier protein
MINVTVAHKRIQEALVGFPSRVTESYLAFAEHGDMTSLDVVVLGVLQFYLAKKPKESLDSLPGTTRLVEDLGCDSLTMMDTVFMAETLLEIKIDDTELARLATLDELRGYFRREVKSGATSTV